MTGAYDNRDITDGELVALLDGELSADDRSRILDALIRDAELRRRLETLKSTDLPFRQAFEPLLRQAPRQRLEERLGAAGEQAAVRQARTSLRGRWRWAAIVAGMALALGVAFQAGRMVEPGVSPSPDWRQAVADYQVLYSEATLAGPDLPPAVKARGLEQVGQALGIDVDQIGISVAGLDFKRAQILEFEGEPLAQLAYLYEGRAPVAFCIRRTDEQPSPPKSERLRGLNARHWVRQGWGFIVIGDVPDSELRAIADSLDASFDRSADS